MSSIYKNLIIVTDSTEKRSTVFSLRNEQWPFVRLTDEFRKIHSLDNRPLCGPGWKGFHSEFVKFIKERGAVEVDLPVIDIPSWPDPDWD